MGPAFYIPALRRETDQNDGPDVSAMPCAEGSHSIPVARLRAAALLRAELGTSWYPGTLPYRNLFFTANSFRPLTAILLPKDQPSFSSSPSHAHHSLSHRTNLMTWNPKDRERSLRAATFPSIHEDISQCVASARGVKDLLAPYAVLNGGLEQALVLIEELAVRLAALTH
jgi:hypothetical protein